MVHVSPRLLHAAAPVIHRDSVIFILMKREIFLNSSERYEIYEKRKKWFEFNVY